MQKRMALAVGIITALLLVNSARAAYYSNDFEAPANTAGWSTSATSTSPSGQNFLGNFANNTVTLSLDGLPAHSTVTVAFDLYIIRSWDGNADVNPTFGPDIWGIQHSGDSTLLRTTFSNGTAAGDPTRNTQAYPDFYPGGAHAYQTGASAVNTLGYSVPDYGDSIYRLEFTFPHTASTLQLDFYAEGLTGVWDESWGIDNIVVTPEPTTLSLVVLGGIILLRRR